MINIIYSLNPTVLALFGGIFSFFITTLGSAIVFFFKRTTKTHMNMLISIAAGIMFSASFFSLLNPAIILCSDLKQNFFGCIIGGFIGKKFGQMIGVAVASFVAGVVYDMFTSSTNAEVLIPIQDVIESVDPYLWTDGEIHNAILCQLTNNLTRQNTRSGELELTISQIFDEAIKYSQELINEPIEIDPKFREYMESFCKEVECSMLKRGCNAVDFSVIFTDYLSSQNIEVADDLGLIYNNLLNSSSLDNKLLSEYEISYLKMIDHSALSNEDKALLSTTGSVAIRSGQFWHNR